MMDEQSTPSQAWFRRSEQWERQVIAHLLDHGREERDVLIRLPIEWFSYGPPRDAVAMAQERAIFGGFLGRGDFVGGQWEPEDDPMLTFVWSLPECEPKWSLRQKLYAMRVTRELERVTQWIDDVLDTPLPDAGRSQTLAREMEYAAYRLLGLTGGEPVEAGPPVTVKDALWKYFETLETVTEQRPAYRLLPGFTEAAARLGRSGLVLVEGSGKGSGDVDRYALAILLDHASLYDLRAVIYHPANPFGKRDLFSELMGLAPVSLVGQQKNEDEIFRKAGNVGALITKRRIITRRRPSLDQGLLDALRADLQDEDPRLIVLYGFGWRELNAGPQSERILRALRETTRENDVVIILALDRHEPGLLPPEADRPFLDHSTPERTGRGRTSEWHEVRRMATEWADFVVHVRRTRLRPGWPRKTAPVIALRKGPSGPLPCRRAL